MKRNILLILVALLPLFAKAYQTKIDGIYYNFSGNNAEVTYYDNKYNSYSGVVVIPAIVHHSRNTYSVTSIGSSAFRDCSGLTSVTIPDRVTSIGNYAFYYCTGLTSFIIPSNSVKTIGDHAFYGCSGLTSVFIPNCVTSVGDYAYRDCSSLKSVTIGHGVTFIGRGAFENCSKLTSITIGNNLKTLGDYAFYKCSGLTSIVLPNSVTNIGVCTFKDCSGLTSITIGYGVNSIGDGAFEGCSNLTSVRLECETPVTITKSTFSNRKNATLFVPLGSKAAYETASYWKEFKEIKEFIPEVNGIYYKLDKEEMVAEVIPVPENGRYTGDISIPSSITYIGRTYSVTSIGSSTFEGCTGLTSLTIPNSVTNIGNSAFKGCSGLSSFIIPSNSVKTIGNDAFSGCSGLTSFFIPNCVTDIGNYAFANCSGLTSVTIGNGVTSIGSGAFDGCTGLTNVTINCPNVGSWFYNLSSIQKIILGGQVTSIGEWAFEGCSGLTSITIPNSVTRIGGNAFKGCTGLTSITIPNSVTSIGRHAFEGCTGITSIIIPSSVMSIGNDAFNGCSDLTSVTIGCGVTSIGNGAFTGCSSLTTVVLESNSIVSAQRDFYSSMKTIFGNQVKTYVIGNAVRSIGNYAFSDCSGLTSVTIGNGVTSIGYDAFFGCSGLTSVTIGNGVTSIGHDAFYDCSSLTSVHISDLTAWCDISFYDVSSNPLYYAKHLYQNDEEIKDLVISNDVTSIRKYAFYGCSGLTSVTIGRGVTSIGNAAFGSCVGLTSVHITDLSVWCNISFDGSNANPLSYVKHLYLNGEEIKKLVIPNDVTSIKNYAFYGCCDLTSVTIPNSVTSIGSYAFNGCSGLTSVTIPNSVTSIGDWAFYGCSRLTSVTLESDAIVSKSRTYNTSMAYIFGNQVKTYVIGDAVSSIGNEAFYNCSSLTSVTIPESVTSIGDRAFYGCSGLTSVHITDLTAWCNISFKDKYSNPLYYAKHLYLNGEEVKDLVIPKDVTSIGNYTFEGCSGLTSVTIPESVNSIGSGAFEGCTRLSTVVLESNSIVSAQRDYYSSNMITIFGNQVKTYVIGDAVKSIGNYAFYGCSGLTSVIVPQSVTTIGKYAFCGCSGLTSITIPNGVPSIGECAFYECSSLSSVSIGNSVTNIEQKAFSGCKSLTSVTLNSDAIVSASRTSSTSMKSIFGYQVKKYVIGNAVESIGEYAFYDCTNLTSITIPYSVVSIGDNAFANCNIVDYYVNRGSLSLFYVWNAGKDPCEIGTSQRLARPSVSVTSITQTSIGYRISNKYPELEYSVTKGESIGDNDFLITGLTPEYDINIGLTVRSANNSYSTSTDVTTSPISPTAFTKNNTPTSITAMGSYTKGDAKVVYQRLEFMGRAIEGEGKTITIKGLEPYSNYPATYIVGVAYGNNDQYIKMYTGTAMVYTSPLSLITQQPKVISEGNVIVAAVSNLEDEDAIVGFEWRRTDWPDDFESSEGVAYLYEGMMEGYIRNLNTEELWRYRPYFESSLGSRYYGDWVGIDPTNTSYFEPTVHTYAHIIVTGTRAEVKGYAMRGTDNVTSQGFMYWSTNHASSRRRANSIPNDAKTVLASGNVMTATLENLEYDTEYCCVAFVKTSEGETFYGETQTFATSVDPDGVEEVKAAEEVTEIARYDIQGRKLAAPQPGINIIRYSDGTTKKILVK